MEERFCKSRDRTCSNLFPSNRTYSNFHYEYFTANYSLRQSPSKLDVKW